MGWSREQYISWRLGAEYPSRKRHRRRSHISSESRVFEARTTSRLLKQAGEVTRQVPPRGGIGSITKISCEPRTACACLAMEYRVPGEVALVRKVHWFCCRIIDALRNNAFLFIVILTKRSITVGLSSSEMMVSWPYNKVARDIVTRYTRARERWGGRTKVP